MTDCLVCPGDKLSQAVGHAAGKGTYVKGLHICASILGKKQLIHPSQGSTDQVPQPPTCSDKWTFYNLLCMNVQLD